MTMTITVMVTVVIQRTCRAIGGLPHNSMGDESSMIARMWKPVSRVSRTPQTPVHLLCTARCSRVKKLSASEQIVECEETRLGNIGRRAVLAQQLAITQVLRTSARRSCASTNPVGIRANVDLVCP